MKLQEEITSRAEEIAHSALHAAYAGRMAEAKELLADLQPVDAKQFGYAYGQFSQLLAFNGQYQEALDLALWLIRKLPDPSPIRHYAVIAYCHIGDYESAYQDHTSGIPESDRDEGWHYQQACILSGLGRFPEALLELQTALAGSSMYLGKIWDDPDLSFLWDAIPDAGSDLELRLILSDRWWDVLLVASDLNRPFDELDPGNLKPFSEAERRYFMITPGGPVARLKVEHAIADPGRFLRIFEELMTARITRWMRFKTILTLIRSEQYQLQISNPQDN